VKSTGHEIVIGLRVSATWYPEIFPAFQQTLQLPSSGCRNTGRATTNVGLLRRVAWWLDTNVSEACAASIFMVVQPPYYTAQQLRKSQILSSPQ
jgi:hypothetical protein